ncbi:MAG: hypothetical protein LBU37_01060 [Tannerellaceae bacterium]|nr:hypothetical protein [Tannerellaceae bacterium]
MRQASIFNQADRKFLAFAGDIYNQCSEHTASWFVDGTRLTKLKGLLDRAWEAYQANMNRATRNHITSVAKNSALGELKHFISLFIDYLIGNEAVPDKALADMNLRPRRRVARRPLPIPTEAPLLSARIQYGEITVYATRSEHGQPTQGVQRRPYHGFKIRWKFDGEEAWRIELSTRLRHTLYFDDKDKGRFILLSIAWVNPRMQEGPWSASISQVIA